MSKQKSSKRYLYRLPLLAAVLLLLGTALLPLLFYGKTDAAQILNRSLTTTSGVPSQTNVTYSYTFTVAATTQIQSLKFIACTTAVGTYPGSACTAPVGMTAGGDGFSSAAFVSQTGWQGATNFAVDPSGAADCAPSANVMCATRSDTTAQTATSRTIVFNGIKNPSTANTAFYVGIWTYTDAGWTALNRTDNGTTASAIVQTLTAHAAVAEILNFCVGSTTVNDVSTSVATDCSTLSGTSLNLGTLDTSAVNVSPVGTNGGDNQNGVAMVRSNAGNGTVVEYDAIQQSGTNHQGTLRVGGGTCNAVTNTFVDPCINAAGSTQTTFNAGTEEFGMTVAGINFGSTSSYTCTYGTPAGNTCNMEPSTNYLGSGTAGSTEAFGTANGFAWDESGTAVPIASSANSTVKQVDDEALILSFAATPSITTPFGAYSDQTDFIAVPTY